MHGGGVKAGNASSLSCHSLKKTAQVLDLFARKRV